MKHLIKPLTLFTIILFGCSEELVVTPYSYTTVLTGESRKGWTIRNIQFLEEGKGTQTFGLPGCIADDVYIFYANTERTYEVVEGASKCAEQDPTIVVQDTWSFGQATATLSIIFPLLSGDRLPFVLREAEDNRMSLEFFFNEGKSSYRINFRSTSLE